MIEHAGLGTTIVLQFATAFPAPYLVGLTGWRVAWNAIAGEASS